MATLEHREVSRRDLYVSHNDGKYGDESNRSGGNTQEEGKNAQKSWNSLEHTTGSLAPHNNTKEKDKISPIFEDRFCCGIEDVH